jgi:hypothetical protein
MGDDQWRPGLHSSSAYSPADLFRGQSLRRRSSLGTDAALDAEQERDPESQVDDYEELVRCLPWQIRTGKIVVSM